MMKLRSVAILLLGAMTLASCDKNAVQDITGTLPGSRIKFFNFGINAPSVNFYANTQKMTAITSATGIEAVTGVAYGGVGAGGFYSAINPGQYAFTGKISAATDKDLTVATVSSTLADGKAYSFYMSGFYDAAAKTVEGFVVEDPVDANIDFTVAYVRFVNASPNSSPMTLFAKNSTTGVEAAIGAAIAYKSGGAFTSVPSGVYDLGTRLAGVSTNAISRTAVSFSAGKVYTISARGDMTIVSTTATNRPVLDNTANR